MSTVVLGCDDNDGKNAEWQNTVAKALEDAGHTVEKLPIDPTPFGQYSYGEAGYNPRGKIGVYIMADSLVSVADLAFGGTSFKYAYFIIRMDLNKPRMSQPEHFNTSPIGRDGDCTSVCDHLAGKTYAQMNEICKDKCQCTWGRNPKEGAENLIKTMGGEVASSSSTSKSNGSSIKSAIKQVLYGWNGDVECYLKDDTIHIHKIRDPTSAKLKLIEDVNVFLDSISVTDIDPNTPNKLIVKWKNNSFIIKDAARIKRFGEVSKTIKSSNKTEKDAVAFAYHEWNKLLKNDGRKLECKVDGAPKWRIGQWVRVYIPSFDLNGYMYLTKVSHDDDGKWKTNLTLEDYPPDLGEKPSENSSKKASSSSSTASNSTSNSSSSSSSSDTSNNNDGGDS